jgi:hypothetical protein
VPTNLVNYVFTWS